MARPRDCELLPLSLSLIPVLKFLFSALCWLYIHPQGRKFLYQIRKVKQRIEKTVLTLMWLPLPSILEEEICEQTEIRCNSDLFLSPKRFGYSFFSCNSTTRAWLFKTSAWIEVEFLGWATFGLPLVKLKTLWEILSSIKSICTSWYIQNFSYCVITFFFPSKYFFYKKGRKSLLIYKIII